AVALGNDLRERVTPFAPRSRGASDALEHGRLFAQLGVCLHGLLDRLAPISADTVLAPVHRVRVRVVAVPLAQSVRESRVFTLPWRHSANLRSGPRDRHGTRARPSPEWGRSNNHAPTCAGYGSKAADRTAALPKPAR